ncbi:Sodium/calcium exchanger 3 [Symbiodinium microadriaticum]|uniref:Sodium/calcium exchanger 3 n=1 Tax=Symbiodinium microadriaticum TaxID=2951 RepID=A0A1Q9EP80_SYMMI|nr:Sodium/calcium exchanger 3 [Symbiodinium microadriaticum]
MGTLTLRIKGLKRPKLLRTSGAKEEATKRRESARAPPSGVAMDNVTVEEARICEEGGSGQWLPMGGEWELNLNPRVRMILYFIGMLYSFMGVSIVADLFMSAIERVTSVQRCVQIGTSKRYKTSPVWNETVATLTLMALGSSAPEIMLSLNDIIKRTFVQGKLGASTIVGSAAFNLFVIVAVCINAIPAGESRQIKQRGVYAITAFFSIFAYVWLLFICVVSSIDEIELWEGAITFLYFPVFVTVTVIVCYLSDIGVANCVSQPNHVRIFWSTDAGSVLAQSKHWLTSPEWSPAMVLLEREDVQSLSMLFPPVVEPCWDDSFLTQAQSWFQKLRELLQAGNMQTSGVDQCLAILHHEDEDFLPSKQSVGDRIVKIRRAAEQQQRNAGVNGGLGFSEELRKAMSAAFPGSSAQNRPGSTGLIRVVGARAAAADSGFCNDELETGMLVIFECGKNRLLPCRVGRILRIMREHSRESTAIIEVWRDIAKPGKYERPNLFGTWSPPTKVAEVSAAKRRRGCALQHVITIPLGKVLVWPLTLEAKEGQDASDESGKIPLAAMHFHAFSARGCSQSWMQRRSPAFFVATRASRCLYF